MRNSLRRGNRVETLTVKTIRRYELFFFHIIILLNKKFLKPELKKIALVATSSLHRVAHLQKKTKMLCNGFLSFFLLYTGARELMRAAAIK